MIKSLKKALLLIPAYIGLLLCCCVIGELIYMLYFNTTGLIAGKTLQLVNRQALFDGFFIIMPVVIILSGTLLSCYRVRHSGDGIFPVIMYVLLGAATWLFLYPGFIMLKSKASITPVHPDGAVTAGYYRQQKDGIVYLLHDLDAESADAVIIDGMHDSEDAVTTGSVQRSDMDRYAAPFKDSLIRDTIPVMPGWVLDGFLSIESCAEKAWSGGRIKWLCFISLGAALFSVYGLTFCSEWRFINILYLFIMETGVLVFNFLYYSVYFTGFRRAAAGLGKYLHFFRHLDEPMLTCTNLLIAVLFTAIGIIAAIARAKNSRRNGI